MLTASQAYDAMFCFLDHVYSCAPSNDVAALLGDLACLEDGMPVNAATWDNWLDCAGTDALTPEQAFVAMRCFLSDYFARGSVDIAIPDQLMAGVDGEWTNVGAEPPAWPAWAACVRAVIDGDGSDRVSSLRLSK
jgi:hypothetical protein